MSGNRPKTRKQTDRTERRNVNRKTDVKRRKEPVRAKATRSKRTDKDGWKGLEDHKVRRPRAVPRSLQDPLIQRIATIKMAIVTILALGICTIYIDHVLDTKELFTSYQTESSENRRLHLKMNRLHSEVESKTSPGSILKRADELGLRPSKEFGTPIILDQEKAR